MSRVADPVEMLRQARDAETTEAFAPCAKASPSFRRRFRENVRYISRKNVATSGIMLSITMIAGMYLLCTE